MASNYIVRTIFLQNYFAPADEMAQQRRDTTNMENLVGAMKRTEHANQTLERELNGFSEKGYNIVSIIQHPLGDHPTDLLITVILSEQA